MPQHETDPGSTDDAKTAEETGQPEVEAEVVEAEEEVVVELSQEEVLSQRLKETEARLRTVSKAYKDLQGEMQSFRGRVEAQERAKAVRRSAEIVKALLEPVENLRRSIDNPGDDITALVGGLKLVNHQFAEAMKKVGLREIGHVGAFFDPKEHEALAMTPVTDPSMDGRILMVHSSGYAVAEHVLQPAQVIVGKYEAPAQAEPEAEDAEEAESATEAPVAEDAGEDEADA